jgi:hypothetical protein
MTKTIKISDETYESIKEQLGDDYVEVDVEALQDFVGKKLFIRTVTYHLIGKVKKVFGNFIELEGAVWVASSGRFMQALEDGTLDEVEPCKTQTWVNANSITDMFLWKHKLPTEQK